MPRIRRVLAGLAAAAVALPAAAALTTETDIPFRVDMGGSPIGTHTVRFEERGDELHVFIDIALSVGFAFVTLYRYEHSNHEIWRDGRLVSIKTETNDDGEDFTVRGEAVDGGFRVTGVDGEILLPADVAPTSYWTADMLDAPAFLDTQRGVAATLSVSPVGDERLQLASGERLSACRVKFTGDLNLDSWYDEEGRWVKMAFSLKGNDFDYQLLRPARSPWAGRAQAPCA